MTAEIRGGNQPRERPQGGLALLSSREAALGPALKAGHPPAPGHAPRPQHPRHLRFRGGAMTASARPSSLSGPGGLAGVRLQAE